MSSLLPYGVESSPAVALQQQQRNEEQLRLFHRQLQELSNEKAQSEHREQQLLAIFQHLRSCPPQLQLDLLDLLSSLVERRPSLITGCKNLLPLTIRLLTDLIHSSAANGTEAANDSATADLYAAMYMKLFWLVGSVGKETITVRDLNRLFRLFQLVVEKRAQPLLCRLLLSALTDMANVHENKALQSTTNSVLSPMAQAAHSRQSGQPAFSFQSSASLFPPPSAFFEFQGPQPALVIPPMERWPFPKAYTICMWLRWDHTSQTAQMTGIHPSQMPVAAPASLFGRRPQPTPATQQFAYLYSLLTSKARGIEACIDKATRKLYLRSAGKSSQVESCTEVVIPVKQWLLLSITHTKPKTFSRSQGTVTVMVNDEVRYEGELVYPTVVEAMVSNSIGANITNIKPGTAFHGRIGSLYFFHRQLTTQQIAVLARKGSDFPMNTLVTGEKAGLLKALVLTGVNALLNPLGSLLGGGNGGSGESGRSGGGYESSKTSEGAETAVDAAMRADTFRALILLYHPKCVENEQMVVDTSHVYTKVKSGLNATMAAGVESFTVNNVKEVLHCMIGGVRALFPIFFYIDALSPAFSAATKGRSSASLLPLAVSTLTVMLRDNVSNQREMLSCSGMAVLAYLLRVAPAHHLNEHMLTSIEELVQYTSWLVTAKAAEGDDKSEPAAEQRKAVGGGTDFLAALSDGQWIPGMANVSLPPSAATERSLFNDLFLHVLFNLALWARCDYNVQADVVRMVRSHVSKQAKYFRRMLHPTVILDRMRRVLSYEDAIQQEMVKDIRAREAAAVDDKAKPSNSTVPPSSNSSPSLPASLSFSSLPPLNLPTSPSPPPSIASPTSASLPASSNDNSARDSAIALRIRQLRYLRSEWFIVVKDMMLADLSRRALASDVYALVQLCCDMTDPLQIAEVLELLTQLSFAHPDQVHPLLSRCGGATLFITILQRHSHHVHVQVASFHLLSVMLRGLPPDIRPEQQQQLSAIFSAIHTLMLPHPLTLVAYQALMELILALAPGALGVKNGAEYAVDFYFKAVHTPAAGEQPIYNGGATSPAYSRSTSPRAGADLGGSTADGAVSSFSSMSFARQCTIRFPVGLEILFSLCKKDKDNMQQEERERVTVPTSSGAMPNSPSLPTLLSPPLTSSQPPDSPTPSPSSSSPPLPPSSSFNASTSQSYSPSHITRLVPAMSMSQLLLDVDSLLSASPSQCATILNRWAAWPRPLIAQLDWHASTIDAATSSTASSGRPSEAPSLPPLAGTFPISKPKPVIDAFGLFSDDMAPKQSKGFFDLDTFTSGGGADNLDVLNSQTDVDVFLQATQSNQREDVFASLMQPASPTSTASAATATNVTFTEPVPLLSSRILETLLYHALVHVRDGWVHWRDTLMFLRSAAQAERVEEERFRAVRRELFVGLLQRLGQSVGNDFYLSTGAVTEQLRVNMAHLIDIMEDILYFDEVKATGATANSRLRVEEIDTRTDTTLSAPSSMSPEPSLSSRSTGEDSWMVVTEEDTTDILSTNTATLSSSPAPSLSNLTSSPSFSAISGSSTTSSDHIRLMRGEWVLINQLLSSIISLQLPLTPHRHLSNRPESNSFFDALKSSGDEPQPVRAGGPLRVVVRLILDCIASVVAGVVYDESGGKDEAVLGGKDEQRGPPAKQIQSMFASLNTICNRELSPSSSSSASISTAPSSSSTNQKNDRAAERTWKNRYALTVLARLTAMCKSAPVSLIPALVAGCRQLVDVLQPFALVSALNFASGVENSDGQDRVIYVPVMVTQQGVIDISPSFNFQLSSSAAEVPGMSAASSGGGGGGNMSAELLAAHKRVQDSMNSGAQTRLETNASWMANSGSSSGQSRVGLNTSTDDIFFAPPTGSLPNYSLSPPSSNITSPRTIGSMYPSSFVEPQSSSSYARVMRGCMDYISSCVKLVSTAETRYAAEYNLLIEKQRNAVLSRLRSEREQWRRLAADLLQSAARVLQSHQYSEANRKAVVDALAREQQREVAELWRSFQWQLFVEGSAWLPASMIGKRRYWQIDHDEQSNRMRRKVKQFYDGNDLRQASQTYLLELERQKQLKAAANRNVPANTTAVKKKRTASSLSTTGSRQLTAQPTDETAAAAAGEAKPEAALAASGSERKEGEYEAKGLGPGLGEVIESMETETLADGGEEDIDQMRAQLQQISGALNLKKLEGAEEEEEREGTEPEYGDDGADVTDPSVVAQPTVDDDSSETAQSSKEDEMEKEEGVTAADAEWDLCVDNPDLNRPVISANANSYTSLNVMLVLPFTTVMGSLEIGSRYLQFIPNLNAEMTDRNGNAILEKGGDGRRVWTLPGLDAQRKRAKKTRQWELRDVVAVYRRRYQLQKTALEVFLSNGRNYFVDFGSRDERRLVLAKLLSLKPPRLNRLCSRPAVELMARSKLTQRWQKREITNFEYLMHLNTISGRTYNDLNQYPVFPWILAYYPNKGDEDPDVNIIHTVNSDPSHPHTPIVFRDLKKPIGALDAKRLEQILERYHSFQDDRMPSFLYGSHYSNAGIVMYFLLRFEPYASLHVEFQAGKFDFPDRLFYSIGQTWKTCLNSLSCYKELTPEFFYQPSILDNINGYDLGAKQDGEPVNDVVLPAWAADSAEFIRIHRLALESEYVSQNLHHWVDLIFGYKQKGKAAIDANNVFFHLTYEGAVDLSTITDPVLKNAVKDQIALFGQTPLQLFKKPHPARGPPLQSKIDRLRAVNPQQYSAMLRPDYHHPHVKRMVLADRSSVVTISTVGAKVFTVSANFTVAVHWWNAYQADDYIERKADGSTKRVHLPFTHALAAIDRVDKQSLVTPNHVLFSNDGKLLFEVNNWDDSLRVYAVQSNINTEQLKLGLKDKSAAFGSLTCTLMQHLRQHKGRITCVSLGRDDRTLVTGSTDCTLLVWQLESEEAANKIAGLLQEGKTYVRSEPKHRLRGHEDEVVAVAVQSELDVCVSVSARGLVLLHSLRRGWFLLRIRVPTAHELRAAFLESAAAHAKPDDEPLSPYPSTEELVRGAGNVDQPMSADYGLDDYGGRDTILGARRQSQSQSTTPRNSGSAAAPSAASSTLHLPSLVRLTVEGHMIFFSRLYDISTGRDTASQLSVCTVNGRNWRARLIDEEMSCMALNGEGKLLAVGGVRGGVCIRRLHDLKVIQRFEPCSSQVASIAFSVDMEYLFVSTVQGELSVLVVHC